jgi:hypothetical protein
MGQKCPFSLAKIAAQHVSINNNIRDNFAFSVNEKNIYFIREYWLIHERM